MTIQQCECGAKATWRLNDIAVCNKRDCIDPVCKAAVAPVHHSLAKHLGWMVNGGEVE